MLVILAMPSPRGPGFWEIYVSPVFYFTAKRIIHRDNQYLGGVQNIQFNVSIPFGYNVLYKSWHFIFEKISHT